jgi:chromosomal replication initiation ATPase DnaA
VRTPTDERAPRLRDFWSGVVTDRTRQLIFDLPHEPRYSREDFLVAPANREALRAIDGWPDWPGRMLVLVGPPGAGKSHLGAIWATQAAATRVDSETLADADLPLLGAAKALLIDDADRIGAAEASLFHLVNLARESGAFLLLTATGAPTAWGLEKADLLSRLRLAPQVTLGEPDEGLARAVLVKLFHDRQLIVEPMVIDYIALRIERSLAAARAIVAALDREALARGGAVTRSMAAILLKDAEGET